MLKASDVENKVAIRETIPGDYRKTRANIRRNTQAKEGSLGLFSKWEDTDRERHAFAHNGKNISTVVMKEVGPVGENAKDPIGNYRNMICSENNYQEQGIGQDMLCTNTNQLSAN